MIIHKPFTYLLFYGISGDRTLQFKFTKDLVFKRAAVSTNRHVHPSVRPEAQSAAVPGPSRRYECRHCQQRVLFGLQRQHSEPISLPGTRGGRTGPPLLRTLWALDPCALHSSPLSLPHSGLQRPTSGHLLLDLRSGSLAARPT